MDVGEERVEELLAALAAETQAVGIAGESGQSQAPGAEQRIVGIVAGSCNEKKKKRKRRSMLSRMLSPMPDDDDEVSEVASCLEVFLCLAVIEGLQSHFVRPVELLIEE